MTYDRLEGSRYQRGFDTVTEIDATGKKVKTAGGASFAYDRCIVSPGIGFKDNIEGYDKAAMNAMPHAWTAGEQTVLLRRSWSHARWWRCCDRGATKSVPLPARPYERACQIAMYLREHKPKSKVMIFDARISFPAATVHAGFERHHAGFIEWVAAEKVD